MSTTERLADTVPRDIIAGRPAFGPARDVADAFRTRQSVRAFLPDPVPRAVLRDILETASFAPSGSNLQPWNVFVLTGATLATLGAAIRGAYHADEPGHVRDYNYYPGEVPEPFLSRRRACGWGLYGTLGIARGEKERMKAQRATNYDFFGAPVGLVFTIHPGLETGSWMDYGGFLQSIMVAARGHGLHSCAQASIAEYPDIVRRVLPVPQGHKVVCGMALGFADPAARVNGFRTERAPVDEFTVFLD
jgi:nitroreductase